jgi:5-methylcytosine-specific restriction protein A
VLDHILALSLGGTDADDNLAPACKACNDAKAAIEMRCQSYGPDAVNDPELAEWIRLARNHMA